MVNVIGEIDLERTLTLHKAFWTEMANVAKNGLFPTKRAVLKMMGYEHHAVDNDCFLCEYCTQMQVRQFRHLDKCDWCPVKWTDATVHTPCLAEDSPFSRYCDFREIYHNDEEALSAEHQEQLVDICLTIANLELIEEKK